MKKRLQKHVRAVTKPSGQSLVLSELGSKGNNTLSSVNSNLP